MSAWKSGPEQLDRRGDFSKWYYLLFARIVLKSITKGYLERLSKPKIYFTRFSRIVFQSITKGYLEKLSKTENPFTLTRLNLVHREKNAMKHATFFSPMLSIALLFSPMPSAASETQIAPEVAEEPVNNDRTPLCPDSQGGNIPCPVSILH